MIKHPFWVTHILGTPQMGVQGWCPQLVEPWFLDVHGNHM